MAATLMAHVRVDQIFKAQAAETLAAMGLSIPNAVRALLRVAAEKQLPFELKAQNGPTTHSSSLIAFVRAATHAELFE